MIPVKRFGAAKQRLSPGLDQEPRAALAAAMLEDVLDAIGDATALSEVIVVSGEPAAARAARARGLLLVDDDDSGHSEAAARGAGVALDRGADAVVMLPGDCPLLDASELDAAVARISPRRLAIAPDRHGTGTNGLLVAPPDGIRPAFGPGSRDRHAALGRAAGLEVAVEQLSSLALDLDTPADLEAIRAELADHPGRAPRTAAALGDPFRETGA